MKTILCFGDSNTFGYEPESKSRLKFNVRWTGILQYLLGSDYRIIEEGLCDRMLGTSHPLFSYKNSMDYLEPCLISHCPLDLVILQLGSNDVKSEINISLGQIKNDMQNLITAIKKIKFSKKMWYVPKILLLAPTFISKDVLKSEFANFFNETSMEKSKHLPEIYKELAEKNDCIFFDSNKYTASSKVDGVHLTADGHKIMGKELFNVIKGIL